MSNRKTLQELTIKDNFMFGAVKSAPENCRRLLELILDFPIERVEVHKETTMVYHPEFHGVRLDVYAKDEKNTRYNVEMQALSDPALDKRVRYYHSQLDMDVLQSGHHYDELPDSYVIFICDFDPFGKERYRYSFDRICAEDKELLLQDKSRTIILSTRGKNEAEVPLALVKFLKYVQADLKESTKDFGDEFIKSLQSSVHHIKQSRESESEYMSLELHFYDEYRRGKAEGKVEGKVEERIEAILELLEELGTVSEDLHKKISKETDLQRLREWTRLAVRTESIEQFIEKM